MDVTNLQKTAPRQTVNRTHGRNKSYYLSSTTDCAIRFIRPVNFGCFKYISIEGSGGKCSHKNFSLILIMNSSLAQNYSNIDQVNAFLTRSVCERKQNSQSSSNHTGPTGNFCMSSYKIRFQNRNLRTFARNIKCQFADIVWCKSAVTLAKFHGQK